MTQLDTMTGLDTTGYDIKCDNNHNIITPISPEPKNLELHSSSNSQSPFLNYQNEHPHNIVPSYEDVLSGISQAPYSRVAFANFLKKIHSLENLEFLIHSNYYLLIQNDEIQSRSIWDLLYKNYISLESPKEVNIPYEYKDELLNIYQQGALPSFELISNTMIIIKDLLRDAYLQFISSVKRHSSINENYKFQQQQNYNHQQQQQHHHQQQNLLPTPQYEVSDPGVEVFSPLDNTRSVSPLSYTQDSPISNSHNNNNLPIPRSTDGKSAESLITQDQYIVDEECCYSSNSLVGTTTTTDYSTTDSKKSSVSSGKSINKNSISEVSKKIAGKFKWRRMSSNSSG